MPVQRPDREASAADLDLARCPSITNSTVWRPSAEITGELPRRDLGVELRLK